MKKHFKYPLIAILLPAILILGMLACFIGYRSYMMTHVQERTYKSLFEAARGQGSVFSSVIDERLEMLTNYSSSLVPEIGLTTKDELREMNALFRKQGFESLAIVGSDALWLMDSGKTTDLSDYAPYKASLKGECAADALYSSGKSGMADMLFTVPIYENGAVSAVLASCCTGETMQALITSHLSGGAQSYLIFNASGQIVARGGVDFASSNNFFNILKNVSSSDNSHFLSKDALGPEEAIQSIKNGKSGELPFTYGGSSYYGIYQPAGINDWYIFTTVNSNAAQLEIKSYTTVGRFALVGTLIAAMVLVFFIIYASGKSITALRLAHKNKISAFLIDPLTGLYSKPGFEQTVKEKLAIIPENHICAIISFEVVAFQSYNALYGFETGNALLKKLSDLIRQFAGENDIGSRMYADRFVWLKSSEDIDGLLNAINIAHTAAMDSGLPFFLCGGMYLIDDRKLAVSEMIDKASIAKDTVKGKYSVGIAIYDDSMLECQLEDAEMLSNMIPGLRNGEFVEYYQPQYNTDTGTLAGAEALARWIKPNGEMVMPLHFIELFERNGFIRRLDLYMFERVCKMLKQALDDGRPVVPIAVNFSRVHLYDPNFPTKLLDIVHKYDVAPELLEIELTESAFLMENSILNAVVNELRRHGFRVAIDDFGSGFSSLNMLKDVSVDTLKIDMKFLDGFEYGGKVGTVVTSVVRMAKWLGIPVIAEGVETGEQADFLRSLGCDLIQGYYYSRPIPRAEFEKLLDARVVVSTATGASASMTRERIDAVMGGDRLLTALMDGLLGGFGLYELTDNRLEAIRVNTGYYEIMSYPDMASFAADSLNVFDRIHDDDLESFKAACRKSVTNDGVQEIVFRRFNYFGNAITFKGLISHIGGSHERPLICIATIDVAKRLHDEREKELNKYSDALYGIYDEIFEFNYTDNSFRMLSSGRERCYAKPLPLDKIEGYWVHKMIHPEDQGRISKTIAAVRAGKLKAPFNREYRVIIDGKTKWVSSSMVEITGGSFLICSMDITSKKQAALFVEQMEALHHKVELDEVTGVLSSVATEMLIKEHLLRENRDRLDALMILSIDNFCAITQTFGQPASDELLNEAAHSIKRLFREQDIIGRYQNDKFIIFMCNVSASSTIFTKARAICDALDEIVLPDASSIHHSIGVCIAFPDERNLDTLLTQSEEALREAQEADSGSHIVLKEDLNEIPADIVGKAH
ncbi:MAG: EAL domain-containing protein [Oscillospiraceae bacterium]